MLNDFVTDDSSHMAWVDAGVKVLNVSRGYLHVRRDAAQAVDFRDAVPSAGDDIPAAVLDWLEYFAKPHGTRLDP